MFDKGNWETEAPKMHIRNLQGNKVDNNTCTIRFEVYETDEAGNKVPHYTKTEIIKEDGSKIKRTTSAEYRIKYEVIETIKFGAPIERDIIEHKLPPAQGDK